MTRGGAQTPGPGKKTGRPRLGELKRVSKNITLRPDHIERMAGEKASGIIEKALDKYFKGDGMENFTEKLNFATDVTQTPARAVKIDKRKDVNIYETLCLYCANNDVDLEIISDADFSAASETIENHGINDLDNNCFYFWVDKE